VEELRYIVCYVYGYKQRKKSLLIDKMVFTKYEIVKSLFNINTFLTLEIDKLHTKTMNQLYKENNSFLKDKLINCINIDNQVWIINGEELSLEDIHKYAKLIFNECNNCEKNIIKLEGTKRNIVNHFKY